MSVISANVIVGHCDLNAIFPIPANQITVYFCDMGRRKIPRTSWHLRFNRVFSLYPNFCRGYIVKALQQICRIYKDMYMLIAFLDGHGILSMQ